jgi:hypothetical protein
VQGVYRLLGSAEVLTEAFVAAPGPMGWRYFAHVYPGGSPERELHTIDIVTDLDWNVVRFRLATADGWRVTATPADGGIEVVHGPPDEERLDHFEGATAVWSASPWSLLVARRRLGSSSGPFRAVLLDPGVTPQVVQFSLTAGAARPGDGAERFDVSVNDRHTEALIGRDLPLAAEGWFELISSG